MPTASGKPGWQTTEFWLNLASQIAVVFTAVKGFIPANIATMLSVGGVAVYTIARTIAKAIADVQAAKSAPTAILIPPVTK